MDLLNLIYDHDYFISKFNATLSINDWYEGLELYKKSYLKNCVPPNKVFVEYPEGLLYEISNNEQKCILDRDWLIPYDKESFKNSFEIYNELHNLNELIEYKVKLAKSNLIEIAKANPGELDTLINKETPLQKFIILALAKYSKKALSEDSIDYLIMKLNKAEFNSELWDASVKLVEYSIKEKLSAYIQNSSNEEINDFSKFQDNIYRLRELSGNLSPSLIKDIFKVMSINHNYFNKLVIDILAENNHLPIDILEPLVPIITKIKDDVIFGFIGMRLVQNNLDVNNEISEKLINFVKKEHSLKTFGINYFNKLVSRSPQSINKDYCDNFINVIPDTTNKQFEQIKGILSKLSCRLEDNKNYQDSLNQRDVKIAEFKKHQNSNYVDGLKTIISKCNNNKDFPLDNVIKHLIDLGWNTKIFQNLFSNRIEKIKDYKYLRLIEHLSDYDVSPELPNRYGVLAREIVDGKGDIEEIEKAINSLISDNKLFVAKDDKTFINEIKQLNNNNLIEKLAENKYLEKILSEIAVFKSNTSHVTFRKIGITRNLNNWEKEDYIKWRKSLSSINDINLSEVIAVISQAAHDTILDKESYPYSSQIIAVLSLYKSEQGGIAQIATGEGKSLIIAIFAILKILEGRQVDIVTSANELAIRDAKKHEPLYSKFGITVSHNIHSGSNGAYKADIVYGDMLHFIGDSLRDVSENIKSGRGYDLLIIDEVDNLFIDQNNMRVQLSGTITGFEYLLPILTYIWGHSLMIRGHIVASTENACFIVLNDKIDRTEAAKIIETSGFNETLGINGTKRIDKNCQDYLKDEVKNFTEKTLFAFEQIREERPLIVPNHLIDFVKNQLNNWIDALLISFFLKEKVDYVVVDPIENGSSKERFRSIAPVDFKKTGVIQRGVQWSDGLHQYLQLFHSLTMYPENLVSTYMSYYGFFHKYKGSLYGVTGTLGNSIDQDFLKKEYNVEINIIPTFVEKDFSEYQAIVTNSKDEWQQKIISVLNKKINGLRACLIVLPTILQVEEMYEFIKKLGYSSNHLFMYGIGNGLEKEISERKFDVGDVLIATNLAGRGTDLKLSKEVLRNGGLHVIIASLSDNNRVESQAYGRASRQGQPGSGQIILNTLDYVDADSVCKDLKCLVEERDRVVYSTLKHDSICNLPYLKIKDDLFTRFVNLIREGDSPTGYKIKLNDSTLELLTVNVFLKNDLIFCQIDLPSKNNIAKELSTLIRIIDPKAEQHIRIILKGSQPSPSSLNYQDNEILHYLLALNGNTKWPIILERVDQAFEKLASKFSSEEEYLRELLNTDKDFEDLKLSSLQINDELFQKVKLRKRFHLWIKDREHYTNKFEIKQAVDYWGIWLKQNQNILSAQDNCYVAVEQNKNESSESIVKAQLEANKLFSEFYKELLYKSNKNNFVNNPAHLVSKALHYVGLHFKENNYNKQTANGTFKSLKITVVNFNFDFWLTDEYRINFGKNNYQLDNSLEIAEALVNKAIELDGVYSWQAYNLKTFIILIKNAAIISSESQHGEALKVMTNCSALISNALNKIDNTIIPLYASQLSYLKSLGLLTYNSDLAVHLINSIKIFEIIASHFRDNLKVISNAASEKNKMVKIGSEVSYDQLFNSVNITESINSYFNITSTQSNIESFNNLQFASKKLLTDQLASSGGFVFNLEAFDLQKEEKDWSGTIMAAAIGFVSIGVGIGILATPGIGVFASSFAMSLISGGVGDIITSIQSAITGQPIDFENFLKVKGISIGVAIVTAGTLSFISGFGSVGSSIGNTIIQTGQSAAISPLTFVGKVLVTQAITKTVNYAIEKISHQALDRDINKLERETKEKLDKFFLEHQEYLNNIFAHDHYLGDNANLLQRSLIKDILEVIQDYQLRFQSDGRSFVTGVTHGTSSKVAGSFDSTGMASLGVDVVKTSTDVTIGLKKLAEALDHIEDKSSNIIKDHNKKTLRPGGMLENKLIKEFVNDGKKIAFSLRAEGFITDDNKIKNSDCSIINSLYLPQELQNYNVSQACHFVMSIHNKDYNLEKNNLKDMMAKFISNVIDYIRKNDVVQPLNDITSNAVGDAVVNKAIEMGGRVFDYIKKETAQQSNKQEQQPIFEELKQTKDPKDTGIKDEIFGRMQENKQHKQYDNAQNSKGKPNTSKENCINGQCKNQNTPGANPKTPFYDGKTKFKNHETSSKKNSNDLNNNLVLGGLGVLNDAKDYFIDKAYNVLESTNKPAKYIRLYTKASIPILSAYLDYESNFAQATKLGLDIETTRNIAITETAASHAFSLFVGTTASILVKGAMLAAPVTFGLPVIIVSAGFGVVTPIVVGVATSAASNKIYEKYISNFARDKYLNLIAWYNSYNKVP